MSESETVQKYEIMAIIANSLDKKSAEAYAQEQFVQKVKSVGGTITFEDFWGERGFAYIIKKQKWGYYFVAQFELEKKELTELKTDWALENTIVRFMVSKVDPRAPKPRLYSDVKKEWTALEKEKEIQNVEQKSPAKRPSAPAVSESKKTEPEAKEAKSMTQDTKNALDNKLDKILEDSSLDL